MNIAQFCIDRKVLTYFLTAILLAGGIWSYLTIGRLEDPEFTIKTAQVVTRYPGASAQTVLDEVTDPIEIAVQGMGQLERVTSTSKPGLSIVSVEIKDRYGSADLPQIWDELRRKIHDMADSLPGGASAPRVVDDFGDVYGVFFAIYGDGYTHAELKEYAKDIKRELLLCQDVAKIEMIGDRTEVVHIEIAREMLATIGISPREIRRAISGHSEVADAGRLRVGDRHIRISPTGQISSVEEMGDILIVPPASQGDSSVRLRDIATIRRDYLDPPQNMMRFNGHPCIGLGISTVQGGNVMVMAEAIDRRLAELEEQTPIGIEFGVISHQADSVDVAVREFVTNLIQAIVIVIAVLLVAMGLQSGLLIGAILLITVMGTVLIMRQYGVLLERISLGSFIIALGMLVDNAIVIMDAILVAAKRGEDKFKAAVAVVRQTQWPLLGATAIAVLSFAPIGTSPDSTGEFCRSLFLVILFSLALSWVLAITLTPLLGATFLKSGGKSSSDPYAGRFYRGYRRLLMACLNHRLISIAVLLAMLGATVLGFSKVPQSFFPDSTRPQFMVHMRMPQGVAIEATDAVAAELSDFVRGLDGVTDVVEMVGTGGLRFLLTYSPENPDPSYAVMLVGVDEIDAIERISHEILEYSAIATPDALVYAQRFVLGPGDPQKIQVRILGDDPRVLRAHAEMALDIMRADPKLVEIQSNWRNPIDVIRPVISEHRARTLGISRAEIAGALKAATTGLPIGIYHERDQGLPVILRAPAVEREDTDSLYSAWFWGSMLNRPIPLAQVLNGFENTSEDGILARRDRSLCITVKCNTTGETAATAFARLAPQLTKTLEAMPAGYRFEWGGEHESSREAQAGLMHMLPPILVLMALIVVALFNSIRQPLVIFVTVPLTAIGVTVGLLVFRQPFGFMALLGFLSLAGMQIKNAIVLIDEINLQIAGGGNQYEAIIRAGEVRLRPVLLAALTTILGMTPLVTDPFYASMAVTIMCGLLFATLLTMFVIPLNYTLLYRIRATQK